MNRWTIIAPVIVIVAFVIIGCSKGTGSAVSTEIANSPNEGTIPGRDQRISSGSKNFLLGYYDVYFDPTEGTFEAVENRTAGFTLNMVPLLNNMSSPLNGIMFENIVLNADVPGILGVDVDFRIFHPAPTMDRYFVYDVIGVIIGDGDQTLKYEKLSVAKRYTDLWMKNADGYTRWFNPSEFTAENIFGYIPGGFQNYAGDATVNPYKYYAAGLDPGEDPWEVLTGTNPKESRFHTGDSRTMELEFVLLPYGLGIRFGYAVVFCWEEQGIGPYHPYHRDEAIAASVTLTDDIYYDGVESGGDLILDIELFAWENQPDTLWIDSSVLQSIEQFDAPAIGQPVSEHISTYHIEIPTKPLCDLDDHEVWVIAESNDYDYSNNSGFPCADGPLAAFYRYIFDIADQPYNHLPVIHEIYDDISGQGNGYLTPIPDGISMPLTYSVDYTDADSDTCTFNWYCTVKDIPLNEMTDEVGNLENCPMDWFSPQFGHGEWDLYARVDDGPDYAQAKITITVNNSPDVAGVFGESQIPTTQIGTYSVVATDLDPADILIYDWTVALVGGDEITDGLLILGDGELEIDWNIVGASDGEEYTIDCDVSDGYEVVPATTLTVTTLDYVPLFNLPLREGFSAVDIAVDHSNGDLLILYMEDGAVYKYTEEGDYQDGTEFLLTYEPGLEFIDIAPNSCFIVGGDFESGADKLKFYDPDGSLIGVPGNELYESHCNDVIAFTGHTYTNMLGNSSFTPHGTYMKWRFYEPPDYTFFWYGNLQWSCSPNSFVYAHIRGAECGNITMKYVYYIEGGGYFWDLEPQPNQYKLCDEFRVQRVSRETAGEITNDPSVSWGGIQSDGMDGFNDPQDISRDIDNDFYILDILSTGDPLVKKYTELGVEVGSFGNSTNIAGTPLRIEGSDYDGPHGNLMFVLHEGTPSDMISIFYPWQIPD
ncbi:hypothetical protein KAU08_08635 [bacterium]|nr:hypothetical protein [bacterium]